MTTNNHLPKPPDYPEYEFRAFRLEDSSAILQTMIDIDAHDDRNWAGTLADYEKEFEDPDVNVETDTMGAFTAGGQVAAMSWLYAPPEPGEHYMAFLWNQFHPEHRGNGVADFIMDWSEARGRQILAQRSFDLPHLLRIGCMEHNTYRKKLHARHGFQPVRYFFEMQRDLSEPIADVTLPPGIEIRAWEPDLNQRTYEAFEESFLDHWGNVPMSLETWDLFVVGRESFRPELSFVILDGDEVAGFSINFLSPEENERNGIQQAWVGDLGVRRPWRKQGLATALLNQSMHVFKTEGMGYATLGVDSENPTGALGVYERVGFVPTKRSMSFAKVVHEPRD